MTPVPTAEEQPTLPIPVAARALGVSTAHLYRSVAASTAPVDVLHIGSRRVVVVTASLRRVLGLDPPAPNGAQPARE